LEETRLADLVRMDEARFRAGFADTALLRPRREGLVRNALIVAANTGDGEALEAATTALDDPHPVVRSAAARALGRSSTGDKSRRALEAAREREAVREVREDMERALD
jgi:epoxyqueuosine reductase